MCTVLIVCMCENLVRGVCSEEWAGVERTETFRDGFANEFWNENLGLSEGSRFFSLLVSNLSNGNEFGVCLHCLLTDIS